MKKSIPGLAVLLVGITGCHTYKEAAYVKAFIENLSVGVPATEDPADGGEFEGKERKNHSPAPPIPPPHQEEAAYPAD